MGIDFLPLMLDLIPLNLCSSERVFSAWEGGKVALRALSDSKQFSFAILIAFVIYAFLNHVCSFLQTFQMLKRGLE